MMALSRAPAEKDMRGAADHLGALDGVSGERVAAF
jgi:hypothetical protein